MTKSTVQVESSYIVVIGDMIGSRRAPNRANLQTQFNQVIKSINRSSTPHVISPYTVTLGDEFQAVLSSAQGVFAELFEIQAAIHPIGLRVALVCGPITTALNRRRAIGMDGPAFHQARAGVDHLKATGRRYSVDGVNLQGAQPTLELVNTSLDLLSTHITRWTASRYRIVARHIKAHPVASIASDLKMSDKGVYKSIKDGDLSTVAKLVRLTEEYLDTLSSNRE